MELDQGRGGRATARDDRTEESEQQGGFDARDSMSPERSALHNAANSDNSLMGYAAINTEPDQAEIARLAYEYYLERQRGGGEGSPEEDWLRAERELRGEGSRG